MAREEEHREDLMKEATGLVRRAAYKVPEVAEELVIGFRKVGAMSIFVDQDPVYQFNTMGELRRAYVSGIVYKVENRKLIAMQRERTENESLLLSKQLEGDAEREFLAQAWKLLDQVQVHLENMDYELLGEITDSSSVKEEFLSWMQEYGTAIQLSMKPNVVAAP